MSRLILSAKEEKAQFSELLGTYVTFAKDIYFIGGSISHPKGEKAYISDVQYVSGFYNSIGKWEEPKIFMLQINNVKGHWHTDTFVEFQKSKHETDHN